MNGLYVKLTRYVWFIVHWWCTKLSFTLNANVPAVCILYALLIPHDCDGSMTLSCARLSMKSTAPSLTIRPTFVPSPTVPLVFMSLLATPGLAWSCVSWSPALTLCSIDEPGSEEVFAGVFVRPDPPLTKVGKRFWLEDDIASCW